MGTDEDVTDLRNDLRGWSMDGRSDVVDAGDQNGDGRADIATENYVYFTDPASAAPAGTSSRADAAPT